MRRALLELNIRIEFRRDFRRPPPLRLRLKPWLLIEHGQPGTAGYRRKEWKR